MKGEVATTEGKIAATRAIACKGVFAACLCGSALGWFFPFEAHYQYLTFFEEGLLILNDPTSWFFSLCCFISVLSPVVAAIFHFRSRLAWLLPGLMTFSVLAQSVVFSRAGWALTPWGWINLSASVISLSISIGFLVNKARKS
jgi:hypothetical protein